MKTQVSIILILAITLLIPSNAFAFDLGSQFDEPCPSGGSIIQQVCIAVNEIHDFIHQQEARTDSLNATQIIQQSEINILQANVTSIDTRINNNDIDIASIFTTLTIILSNISNLVLADIDINTEIDNNDLDIFNLQQSIIVLDSRILELEPTPIIISMGIYPIEESFYVKSDELRLFGTVDFITSPTVLIEIRDGTINDVLLHSSIINSTIGNLWNNSIILDETNMVASLFDTNVYPINSILTFDVIATQNSSVTFVSNITYQIPDTNTSPFVENEIADQFAISTDPNLIIDLDNVFEDNETSDENLFIQLREANNGSIYDSITLDNHTLIIDFKSGLAVNDTIDLRVFDEQFRFIDYSFDLIVTIS